MEVGAIRFQQKGVVMYATALPLGEVRKHAQVDYWTPDNPDGYQRPLADRRLREVARYVVDGEGILATSLLLCARPGTGQLAFRGGEDMNGRGQVGTLSIADDATLWVVDGQHRLFGVNSAYEREDATELETYTFPVTIIENLDRYHEMTHFHTIHTTQKKVPTDIADRQLLQRQQQEGRSMMAKGALGEKDYRRASATKYLDKLNEAEGVWHEQIQIPGVVGRDNGLVRQHAMVVSLDPVLRDPFVLALSEDDKVKLLINYWGAAADAWPEAFASPAQFRVQATVGIYSLHMVLPSVIQICMASRDLSREKMAETLKATGITSQFWQKDGGDPMTVGTGMASIRYLAESIRDMLPRATGITL